MKDIKISDTLPQATEILTEDAIEFLVNLHTAFESNREKLLQARELITLESLDFLPRTLEYKEESPWQVAKIPDDMKDRTVEITGPVERKMVINALNSGANCFMADFEDSNSPSWENCINGQINLRDAINKTIEFSNSDGSKTYKLNDKIAKLMVRPRGLHLTENHFLIGGQPISASLFDFGLFMFHNAKMLTERGETPAFYLPKLEDHAEAKWWNSVISTVESILHIPHGSVRVTILIETLPAAFRMEEILWELRDYIAGLNAGRWDYLFSAIKIMGREHIFPNRSQLTMDIPMMRAYSTLLVQTCHKHGAQAIGGMAAQIPRKDDDIKNIIALSKVRKDKAREANMGYDGTWVAHPGLVEIARETFEYARNHNQEMELNEQITREDLLQVPDGDCTYDELVNNVRIALKYMHSWVNGNGCVAIDYLMEDLATFEISRIQLWNWIHHGVELKDGEGKVNHDLIDIVVDQVWNPEYEDLAIPFSELILTDKCKFSSLKMYTLIKGDNNE